MFSTLNGHFFNLPVMALITRLGLDLKRFQDQFQMEIVPRANHRVDRMLAESPASP
jgi:hypothetical protein